MTSDPVVGGSGGRLPSPEDPPPAGGGRRASRHFLADPASNEDGETVWTPVSRSKQ